MVLPPTLQRHEFAQSIHATFLYPTARLPPLFDAVVVCRCSGGDYRWVVCCKKKGTYIQRTPPPMEKKKSKKKGIKNRKKKKEVPSIELANFDGIV